MNGIETQEKKLNIQLNKEVTHIQIKPNEKKVLVQTKAGERYTSDVVVVTVPLGVLKADVINFSPPLPDDFQQAVRQVGEDHCDCSKSSMLFATLYERYVDT